MTAALLKRPTSKATATPAAWTVADLRRQLGDVPLRRIWLKPAPGTATVEDVVYCDDQLDRICELIDGTLVEKAMGYDESRMGLNIAFLIGQFLQEHPLGILTGEAGMMQLFPNQVRIPDVAFASWNRFPNQQVPKEPVPDLVPDLAVEVLSKGNTRREMGRKLREYFEAGVGSVWYVDPKRRVVSVYRGEKDCREYIETESITDIPALPGLKIPVAKIFAMPRNPNVAATD